MTPRDALSAALYATGNTAGVPGQDRGEATDLMAERILASLTANRWRVVFDPERVEARLAEAERLLVGVRNADVIFGKSDWNISRAIEAFLAAPDAEQP